MHWAKQYKKLSNIAWIKNPATCFFINRYLDYLSIVEKIFIQVIDLGWLRDARGRYSYEDSWLSKCPRSQRFKSLDNKNKQDWQSS
jgi:hypothetical protein